jgi:hypothetical protein
MNAADFSARTSGTRHPWLAKHESFSGCMSHLSSSATHHPRSVLIYSYELGFLSSPRNFSSLSRPIYPSLCRSSTLSSPDSPIHGAHPDMIAYGNVTVYPSPGLQAMGATFNLIGDYSSYCLQSVPDVACRPINTFSLSFPSPFFGALPYLAVHFGALAPSSLPSGFHRIVAFRCACPVSYAGPPVTFILVFTAGILLFGVGLQTNTVTCSSAIYLCIIFYGSSKVLIYIFLSTWSLFRRLRLGELT